MSSKKTVNTNFLSLLIRLDEGRARVFRLRGERSNHYDTMLVNIYIVLKTARGAETKGKLPPALFPRGARGSTALCITVR